MNRPGTRAAQLKESGQRARDPSVSGAESATEDQLIEQLRPLARALIRQARMELARRRRMLDEAA
jgi:hypothetical protein